MTDFRKLTPEYLARHRHMMRNAAGETVFLTDDDLAYAMGSYLDHHDTDDLMPPPEPFDLDVYVVDDPLAGFGL